MKIPLFFFTPSLLALRALIGGLTFMGVDKRSREYHPAAVVGEERLFLVTKWVNWFFRCVPHIFPKNAQFLFNMEDSGGERSHLPKILLFPHNTISRCHAGGKGDL